MLNSIQVPNLDHDAMMSKEFNHKITPNGAMERRIVAALIAHMAERGFLIIGVWDGEEWEKADTAKEAMEFIFNLDDCSLRFVKAEGFDREAHEKTRDFDSRNAYAANEHGVYLVLGNNLDIISDWNYFNDDSDGFNAAMDSFIDKYLEWSRE